MPRDFTLGKYEALCAALRDSPYQSLTVRAYLEANQEASPAVILRHDVDRRPAYALHMARVEQRYGLTATYYFRTSTFRAPLVQEIAGLGHEIGYHYETLARARGDASRAYELFLRELDAFRRVCDIATIAMHGSPLSKCDNRDLWKTHEFAGLNILGETYLSLDYERLAYLTDTGRAWDAARYNVRDRVSKDWNLGVSTTDDLVALVAASRVERLCIQTHPERWAPHAPGWAMSAAQDAFVNQVKRIIRMRRRKTAT